METKTVSRTFNEFEDFNVGDIVKLKSGGPNMTVDNASSSRIICKWFDSTNICFIEEFDQGALEKVTPAEHLLNFRCELYT
jgi:uncharacterized protein YodC (DUF2158 family)